MDNKYINANFIYTDMGSHLSNVQRLPNGSLFAVASMCKSRIAGVIVDAPASQYLFGRISNDEGKNWSAPYLIYEFPEKNARISPDLILCDKDGYIHIFFERTFDIFKLNGDIYYLRLDNEKGENPIFKKLDCLDRYTGSMNNLIQLESGRIIAPFSTVSGVEGSTFVSSVAFSDDAGLTWKASNDVSLTSDETHVESGALEPVVVEVKPNVLVMLIRNVLSRIYYSVSYNGGEKWSEARPTNIASSNAPSVPIKMPDGRIVIAWNDVLGQPMDGIRYSQARQCLHAAVSHDGLKTIVGCRMIVKKEHGDPYKTLNCYPFATLANDKEIFIRYVSVWSRLGAEWAEPQASLISLNPDFLDDSQMFDDFTEGDKYWVTNDESKCLCINDENVLSLNSTETTPAYGCVNFPFATKGQIDLKLSGVQGARLILSECYLDVLNFLKSADTKYAEVIGKPYVELPISDGAQNVNVNWDNGNVVLTDNNGAVNAIANNNISGGFNHMILISSDGHINVHEFSQHAENSVLNTGIEY